DSGELDHDPIVAVGVDLRFLELPCLESPTEDVGDLPGGAFPGPLEVGREENLVAQLGSAGQVHAQMDSGFGENRDPGFSGDRRPDAGGDGREDDTGDELDASVLNHRVLAEVVL